MPAIFLTGFPGFLGSELLPRVLARAPGAGAVCLVQPKFAEQAARRVAEIEAREPATRGRIDVVAGDITRAGLGLADAAGVQRDTTEMYHLAAFMRLRAGT